MTSQLREVVADALPELPRMKVLGVNPMHEGPAGYVYGYTADQMIAFRDAALATLPTQSAGVEERWTSFARNDGEGGRVIDPSILDSPIYADQMRAVKEMARGKHKETTEETKLRTKQPAASEGDVVDALKEALSDLLSWFPDKPVHEWRLPAGKQGADDAIAAAKAAIGDQENGG